MKRRMVIIGFLLFFKEHVQIYHKAKLGSLSPHVFALAEAAYRSIVDDKINQVCRIISLINWNYILLMTCFRTSLF